MAEFVATAVWTVDLDIVRALDTNLGAPVDSYVNGSQSWLSADGPGDTMLEWRLHPVGAYRAPDGLSHYDVWDAVIDAIAAGASADELALGTETRPLHSLWTTLECFAAYGDPFEPAPLAAAVTGALGIAPTRFGLVDHEAVTDEWLRTGRAEDLGVLLLAALDPR